MKVALRGTPPVVLPDLWIPFSSNDLFSSQYYLNKGYTQYDLYVVGAGGGGGGGGEPWSTTEFGSAGGGGGGGSLYKEVNLLLAGLDVNTAVVVGKGGLGGRNQVVGSSSPYASYHGAAGGLSSFGNKIAPGGGWGGAGASHYASTGPGTYAPYLTSGGCGGAGGGANGTPGTNNGNDNGAGGGAGQRGGGDGSTANATQGSYNTSANAPGRNGVVYSDKVWGGGGGGSGGCSGNQGLYTILGSNGGQGVTSSGERDGSGFSNHPNNYYASFGGGGGGPKIYDLTRQTGFDGGPDGLYGCGHGGHGGNGVTQAYGTGTATVEYAENGMDGLVLVRVHA